MNNSDEERIKGLEETVKKKDGTAKMMISFTTGAAACGIAGAAGVALLPALAIATVTGGIACGIYHICTKAKTPKKE